jgi:hypothetical protein
MESTLITLFFWALFAVVGYAIGAPKGRPVGGILLGLVLGPIGWLLLAVGPNYKKQETETKTLSPQPAQAVANKTLRIAKDGVDLGDLDIPSVKLRLKTGELILSDYYYDQSSSDWQSLEFCPLLDPSWG